MQVHRGPRKGLWEEAWGVGLNSQTLLTPGPWAGTQRMEGQVPLPATREGGVKPPI